jgi:hypothetical protein
MNNISVLRSRSALLLISIILFGMLTKAQMGKAQTTSQQDCSSQFYSMAEQFYTQRGFYLQEHQKYAGLEAKANMAYIEGKGSWENVKNLRQKMQNAKEKADYYERLWKEALNRTRKVTCDELNKILSENHQLKRPSAEASIENTNQQQKKKEKQLRDKEAGKQLAGDLNGVLDALDKEKNKSEESGGKDKGALKEPKIDDYVPPTEKEQGFEEDAEDLALFEPETSQIVSKVPEEKTDAKKGKPRTEGNFFHEEKTSEESPKSNQSKSGKQEGVDYSGKSEGYEKASSFLKEPREQEKVTKAYEKDGKIVIKTTERLFLGEKEGYDYVYREYELTKNEFKDLLVSHYSYDPLTDKYVSSYTPLGASTFPVEPEKLLEIDQESYGRILKISITENLIVANNAWSRVEQIEKSGITPEMSENLQNDMVLDNIVEAGAWGVAQLLATEVVPVPKLVEKLSDASSASDLFTIAEASKIAYQYYNEGWVPGGGPRLVEGVGGQEGVTELILSSDWGHEYLLKNGFTPTRLSEPLNYNPDQKNKAWSEDDYYDWSGGKEIASKVAAVMVEQVMLWDECNTALQRLNLLDVLFQDYQRYIEQQKQNEQKK